MSQAAQVNTQAIYYCHRVALPHMMKRCCRTQLTSLAVVWRSALERQQERLDAAMTTMGSTTTAD
eukprot:4202947-Amphidinium_carterae.1